MPGPGPRRRSVLKITESKMLLETQVERLIPDALVAPAGSIPGPGPRRHAGMRAGPRAMASTAAAVRRMLGELGWAAAVTLVHAAVSSAPGCGPGHAKGQEPCRTLLPPAAARRVGSGLMAQ